MWFIAHFCVLSNGVYLATAWIAGDRYLDTQKLLEHGAHPAMIAVFSIATIGWGYVRFRQSIVGLMSRRRSGREAITASGPMPSVSSDE